MTLNIPAKPWWETDVYDVETPIPPELESIAGPNGIALTRAWPSGQTQKGWGLAKRDAAGQVIEDGFIENYTTGVFLPRRALYGYERDDHKQGFAFVTRSMRVVVVDIDGKNGGLEFAPTLGNLPYTLGETSKSGTGYHLFYETNEVWDPSEGFGDLPDQIGIVQGVDIRSVGCVYHWHAQRWNHRKIAPLPSWLRDRMIERYQARQAVAARIASITASQDPEDIMMLQAELSAELSKPIPAGKRNTSLFAIGNKMKVAGIPDWETQIEDRANQLGLDQAEIDTLIRNIGRYDV
jgi:hypothetical protein